MKIKETIGIDISKDFFDVCIHSNQLNQKITNNQNGFNKLLKWVFKSSDFKQENTLFIWQVAVDERARGQGLASKMLMHILHYSTIFST